MGSATAASALTINLTDIGGVKGSQAEIGFRIAAKYWESVLTNKGTMNINVGFSDLGPDILGGTRTSLFTYVPIDTYYSLLTDAATSSLDAIALTNLSPTNGSGSVNVTVPGYDDPLLNDGVDPTTTRQAPIDGAPISSTIAISSANAIALGIDASGPDAQIEFSSTFAFDFDPTNGVGTGKYDFIGVAVHEIGHALGFLSGVEDFDFSAGGGFPVDEYWWGYAADMFRYSATDTLDWSVGTPSYFSIDGGATPLFDGYWSTGTDYGNGWQASHWLPPEESAPCVDFRGIMNPYICSRLVDSVTGLDLALLDAIGWDVNFDVLADNNAYKFTTADMYEAFRAAVPEPGTWALMILGFGLTGTMVRRRRHALTL